MRSLLRRFWLDRAGVSAVEMAMVMAVLVPVVIVGSEIQRFMRQQNQITAAADGFAAILSQRALPLRNADWSNDSELVSIIFPELLRRHASLWRDYVGLQATYVRFEPDSDTCASGDTCSYTKAKVLWTWSSASAGSRALLQSKDLLRSCMVLSAGTPVSATSLPADVFGAGTLLAVDIVYAYTPSIFAGFGSKTIIRQAFLPPLYQDLEIDPSGAANEVAPCP